MDVMKSMVMLSPANLDAAQQTLATGQALNVRIAGELENVDDSAPVDMIYELLVSAVPGLISAVGQLEEALRIMERGGNGLTQELIRIATDRENAELERELLSDSTDERTSPFPDYSYSATSADAEGEDEDAESESAQEAVSESSGAFNRGRASSSEYSSYSSSSSEEAEEI